jgi:hypothetical protein
LGQELAAYDFKIVYCPGSQNNKPDALSRHLEYRHEKVLTEDQLITISFHQKLYFDNNMEEIGTISASKLIKRWMK